MDKPTLAENLELRGTKETATEEATITRYLRKVEKLIAVVMPVWKRCGDSRDPSRYSKWCRLKAKGKLELMLS